MVWGYMSLRGPGMLKVLDANIDFSQYMDIFGNVMQGYSSRKLFGNSMVDIHTLFTNLTPLCHIC